MDHIDSVLAGSSLDSKKYAASIHAALRISKKIMNKYYARTDDSEVYRIAISAWSFVVSCILR